jgi:Cof subfamily protein (haloacid dehalogenase superfamily)
LNRKIIFLDIDGTLSTENRVPISAQRACRVARENGHLLYICTGRARSQVKPSIVSIGFDGIISSGGAYIETAGSAEDSWKELFRAAIEPEKLRALVSYFNERKAAYTLELTERLIAGPYLESYLAGYYKERPFTFRRLAEQLFLRQIFRKCERYNGRGDRDDVRKAVFWVSGSVTYEDTVRKFGSDHEIFQLSIPVSGMTGGEIGPQGVHKGSALERVAEYHGFERADTIAFGDSDNDRKMIESAGLGVAMGNAVDSLKAIAGDVTDNIENKGLEKAFKKYGLI